MSYPTRYVKTPDGQWVERRLAASRRGPVPNRVTRYRRRADGSYVRMTFKPLPRGTRTRDLSSAKEGKTARGTSTEERDDEQER